MSDFKKKHKILSFCRLKMENIPIPIFWEELSIYWVVLTIRRSFGNIRPRITSQMTSFYVGFKDKTKILCFCRQKMANILIPIVLGPRISIYEVVLTILRSFGNIRRRMPS